MLWQEFKKMWKRPLIILSLALICAIQFAEVWQHSESFDAGEWESYQKYSGVMDEDWKKWIRDEWEKSGKDDMVLEWAYICSDFQGMVRRSVDNLQKMTAVKDPDYDLDRVERAYDRLMQAEGLHFSSQAAFKRYLANLVIVKFSIILFLILQCVPVFAGEREMGMEDLLAICKYGRKRLFFMKFLVCQISSFVVWLMVNLSAVLAVGLRIGWDGLDGFVQDFLTNTSPFAWNQQTYLCVVGIVGLAACQAIQAVMFIIAYLSKTSVKSAIASFIILFLPTVCSRFFPVFRLLLPNFLAGDYLWRCYTEWRIGSWYLAEWKIAVTEIVFILSAGWIWCLLCPNRIRE